MAQQAAAAQDILKIPRDIVADVVVTASTTQLQNLQIPNDCDFEWWWISVFRTSNLLKLLMTEMGVGNRSFIYSGSPSSSAAFQGILVDNWAGLVQNNSAFPIAVPYVMPANRQYQFSLTDSSGANNTVQIALKGYGLLAIAPPSTSGQ